MSAQTTIVPLRLNAEEIKHLDEMIENNEQTGFENRGEFLRLLLWREVYRRKKLGPPPASKWQSASRVRPKKERANENQA